MAAPMTSYSYQAPGSRGRRALIAKVLHDRCPAAVDRPIKRRAAIDLVLDVQPCASFDEQPHRVCVVGPHSLMQRRRMRMVSIRVVAVRILTGIEEQAHHVGVAVLGGEREGDVSALTV